MIVPDEIRKCVAFIGYRLADGSTRFAGTGFFVARPLQKGAYVGGGVTLPSFGYLLTAKHVLDSVRNMGLSEILVRLNYRDGNARWVCTPIDSWRVHPSESSTVDVAMIPAAGFQPAILDHGVFPISGFATKARVEKEEIGIGEETIIVGLFASHHGNARNIPIVRIGNIAAMPEEKVSTQIGDIDAYLVEARSIGGLSGSPVFVNMGIMRDRKGIIEIERRVNDQKAVGAIYLLGLMHGHFDDKKNSVNMGIGIVVPAAKILEVLNQEAVLAVENETRVRENPEKMPTMDILPEEVEAPKFP